MNAPAHAFLPPSGAPCWVHCAMWPTMNATFPQDDTPETIEGHAAHWVLRELCEGRPPALGALTPQGLVVTDEMVEGAELFRDAIVGLLGPDWPMFAVVEQPLAIGSIHPLNWGTPDLWAPIASRRTIVVADYKFGHGYVDAFENWQLIDYAAGVMEKRGINGLDDQTTEFVFVIVQPRNYHKDGPVRFWRVNAAALRPYFNKLRASAEDACAPNARAVTGEHCEKCPGRHACAAIREANYSTVDRVRVSPPMELDDHSLGLEQRTLLRAKALLDAQIEGNAAQIEARIRAGRRVPFFMLDNVVGREEWLPEMKDTVLFLADNMGKNIRKPADLITPTQAKKAGLPDEIVKQFTTRKSGMKLVPEDTTTARKVFQK